MAIPSFHPDGRDPTEVAATDSYRPTDPVWVYREGHWRSGVIEAASPLAAMVTFRRVNCCGTGVDTVTARYLTIRTDADPALDSAGVTPHHERHFDDSPHRFA
jgi:hypothetical protein